MKPTSLLILILLLSATASFAQVTGTVTEAGKSEKLNNVFIRDINNKQVALSDNAGRFDIKAETGHTLIFSLPGYVSDTLYLIDMKPKKVELKFLGLSLKEV